MNPDQERTEVQSVGEEFTRVSWRKDPELGTAGTLLEIRREGRGGGSAQPGWVWVQKAGSCRREREGREREERVADWFTRHRLRKLPRDRDSSGSRHRETRGRSGSGQKVDL